MIPVLVQFSNLSKKLQKNVFFFLQFLTNSKLIMNMAAGFSLPFYRHVQYFLFSNFRISQKLLEKQNNIEMLSTETVIIHFLKKKKIK